jgi:hypothetical protein
MTDKKLQTRSVQSTLHEHVGDVTDFEPTTEFDDLKDRLQALQDRKPPRGLGLEAGPTVDIPETDELDILRRDNEGLEADNAGLGEEIDKLEKKLDALARRDLNFNPAEDIDIKPSRLTTDDLELSDSSAFSLPASERTRLLSQA